MIYLLTLLSIPATIYWIKTSPARNSYTMGNMITRCVISYICGIGVLTCISDLLGV